jgi:hypothetical protein
MPASFKVGLIPRDGDENVMEETLDPDFGEAAIGRVAPVDSGTLIRGCCTFLIPICGLLNLLYATEVFDLV